jgi:MacB-like periplasmic core domain
MALLLAPLGSSRTSSISRSDNPSLACSAGGIPQTLSIDDAQAIADLNLPINGIAPQLGSSTDIVAAAADKNAEVVGTTPDYFSMNDLHTVSGSMFDAAQVRSAQPVVVLGGNRAKDLVATVRPWIKWSGSRTSRCG